MIVLIAGCILLMAVCVAGCLDNIPGSTVPSDSKSELTPETTLEGTAGSIPESTVEPTPVGTPAPDDSSEEVPVSSSDPRIEEYRSVLQEARTLYEKFYSARFTVPRDWAVDDDRRLSADNEVRRSLRTVNTFSSEISDLDNTFNNLNLPGDCRHSRVMFQNGIAEYRLAALSLERSYDLYLDKGSYKAVQVLIYEAELHMDKGLEYFEQAHDTLP
ncbi:hypothetical protein RJ53_08135 [Methanocalculus chunghsingensis]|uniref:Uncharacterized protein n=2 Tax=Methanocalculus chunghsingensis TaxID=156457 RepID=A0A8J7W6W7_9EURY|nr:hypothetical protein [Methanocalculus chunghsingensis]